MSDDFDATPDVGPEEPDSHVRQAHLRIEELIITMQLLPGQIVSENSLGQMIALGRTPVREALQRLAREGLVTVLPKRGVMISQIDFGRQLRMLEFRRAVERFMVTAAARRASEEERAEFARLSIALEDAATRADPTAFVSLDVAFSEALARAAQNEFATGAMTLMHGLSRRFGHAYDRKGASFPDMARLHAALARAIADANETEALAAIDSLIDYVERFTRRALEPR